MAICAAATEQLLPSFATSDVPMSGFTPPRTRSATNGKNCDETVCPNFSSLCPLNVSVQEHNERTICENVFCVQCEKLTDQN